MSRGEDGGAGLGLITRHLRGGGYLRDSDCTLFSKFLFGFFAGVGVGQVGVKIFIQDLRGLLAEVTPFAPEIRKQVTAGSKGG